MFAAYDATSDKRRITLAEKALKICPKNIDAENVITECEKDLDEKLKKYEATIEKAEKYLIEDNKDIFGKDNVGIFWGLSETRPYMRTRHAHLRLLIELGRYKLALEECEDLLRLCESDNLGIRYTLCSLYAYFEMFDECEKLCNRYNESSSLMLLPYAIMKYKKGDYENCKKVLKDVKKYNPDLIKLFNDDMALLESDFWTLETTEYYAPESKEEALIAIETNMFLLLSLEHFNEFVSDTLKNIKKDSQNKNKSKK